MLQTVKSHLVTIVGGALLLLGGFGSGCAVDSLMPAPTIDLPAELRVQVRYPFAIAPTTNGHNVRWELPEGIAENAGFVARPGSKILEAAAPGRYAVRVWSARGNSPSNLATCIVVAGDVPPGPGPGPQPPGPQPTPVPPSPAKGLRVLFVCESSSNLTAEQLHIWNSTAIRKYLDAKAAPDGVKHWDKDIVLTPTTSETWRSIWAATKPTLGALPVVVVITDQKGEAFPLPATEAATLELLRRYGG